MATTEDWGYVDGRAAEGSRYARCVQELRARVEALEAQQDEPGQVAEAKALWKQMRNAVNTSTAANTPLWPAIMEAVADWLANTGPAFCTAAALLRAEAQATRDGRRG